MEGEKKPNEFNKSTLSSLVDTVQDKSFIERIECLHIWCVGWRSIHYNSNKELWVYIARFELPVEGTAEDSSTAVQDY